MEASTAHTFLSDILHVVSQALLAPDIILLLAFICYALFSIGSVIVELFTERRHFKVAMPKFLAALMDAKEEDIPQVIADSGLLKRQKEALTTVYEYRTLPGDALVALVKRLVSEEETRYDRITGRNNMAAKVAPMLDLMGTLIPLGPGIQALGQADTSALSSSLLVAFDTTVAGLVTAAVCLVIGKIRSNWYEDYLSALDASMATMLEKIEAGRDGSSQSDAQQPHPFSMPKESEGSQQPGDYAFLFGGQSTAPSVEPPIATE
ncbi:MAG: MotA/TolQ/ExbB proton channel family protein [Eggerthellaceae bacterium]|nr:MotA/TolQ/ExbB proton channel family protein [Eggerthellaceae bacterium]